MPSWEECLNKTSLLFSRTLERAELEVWKKFLEPLPRAAVEYAFDNWQRNGRFFPKPKDILDLVDAYGLMRQGNVQTRYEHHGEGYGEADIKWLVSEWVKAGEARRAPGWYEAKLQELDQKRGEVPAWRR